jgi:hypothetical protein
MNKETKTQYAQFIEQQLKIEKFETKATRDLLKYYDTAKKATLKDINRAVSRNYNVPARERLQRVFKETDSMVKALTNKLSKPISKAIGEAGAYSYKDTNRIMSWGGRVNGYDNVSRSASQIASMVQDEKLGGNYLDDWLWKALKDENGALKAEIAAGQIRGTGYKKLMGDLGGRFDNMLSAKGNKQNIETVTKSYIQSSNALAHKEIYEANANIIDSIEWSAILENGNTSTGRGTCPRCAALDGQIYKTVDGAPPCPLHPRCRCMLLPITKTWKELGFDIDEMEPIYNDWYIRSPGRKILQKGTINGSYADWWATRGTTFQNNAIGPRRADLVRSGAIDFDELVVPSTGRLRLIDELKRDVAKPVKGPFMYEPIATAEGQLGTIMTIGKCI